MTNLWTVLYFTLGITLTGLMLVLFKRLFRDKLSARWHYLVWLVLLVRAILPENLRLFSTGFALNTLWVSWMKRLRAAVELGRNSLLSTPFGMGGGEVSLLKKMPFSAWSLTDRLFAVYLAGVAAVLLYDALLYARLRLEIRKGAAATPSLREKIRKTAEKYDLPAQKNVRICKGIETPFLCGMVRPILVVPESMAETIDEKVLLHEMLHLKHHDVLVNFLLHLLQALNWFNPFVYWLCRIIRNDSEALCDQRALEKLRGEEKREYGMLLLDMADSRCASRIGTTSMANGARNIKTRIGRIADFGRVPKGAAFATACITVVLCLASVSFAYQPNYFDTSKVETAEELRLTLEDARLFEIPSAEMAISILYEAFEERDLAKLALTVPEEEFDTYRDWALAEYKAAEDTYHARLDSGTKADYTYRFYDSMEMEDFYLVTVYTPNSQSELRRLEYRMEWERDFLAYLLKLQEKKPVICCGDMNVAHQEIDLKNPKTNRMNAGFTDEERACFTKVLEAGFIDTFRYFYPDLEGAYSWWSYRFKAREKNAGWRIDYFITSPSLKEKLEDAKIHSDIMGSDHCPVELDLKF